MVVGGDLEGTLVIPHQPQPFSIGIAGCAISTLTSMDFQPLLFSSFLILKLIVKEMVDLS